MTLNIYLNMLRKPDRMSKLSEYDIVRMMQKSIAENSYVVAYFSRNREYEYHHFVNIDILFTFLRKNQASDLYIDPKKPHIVGFNSDEWLVFANENIAARVLKQIKIVWGEDSDE